MDWDISTLERWAFRLFAAMVFSYPTWAAGPKVEFHLPAGQASQTLHEFYLQSRVRVLYLADELKDVQTRPLSGEFEAAEALTRLLEGTGFSFEFSGDHQAVIKLDAAAATEVTTSPAPGAGPNLPAVSDAEHRTNVEEVLVTGSLIHGVIDITSPLITVGRTEMQRTAYATAQDAVRAMPMAGLISRGEVVQGVGNFGRGAGINLRGLGDGATLVLVNGRRQPSAGTSGDFVDVSTIPWSMVDHIEVLPDGGSAVYGSDALAG